MYLSGLLGQTLRRSRPQGEASRERQRPDRPRSPGDRRECAAGAADQHGVRRHSLGTAGADRRGDRRRHHRAGVHLRLHAPGPEPAARRAGGTRRAVAQSGGRAQGVSVASLLGGEERPLPAYDSFGLVDPQRARAELERSLARGFKAIKIKLRAAPQAAAASLPVSSHLFAEASAHVLSATPGAHFLEHLDLAAAILADPPPVLQGMVTARGPGLGLEWDARAVATYAL